MEQYEAEHDGSGRPPYAQWDSMWVFPPDPFIAVPFSADAWGAQPIFFFDPIRYYARIGMTSARPCARKGWAHAQHVTVVQQGKFTKPRHCKGRGFSACVPCSDGDCGISTVNMKCSECRRERAVLRRRLRAVEAQLGVASDSAVALKAEVGRCSWGFSALNSQFIAFLAERYPFLHAAVPFSTSHKTAVMHDVVLETGRAMRTSQSSSDLEAQYDELHALNVTKKHVAYGSVQRCILKHEQRKGRLTSAADIPTIAEQWVPLEQSSISRISDNYVTTLQKAEFQKWETYFNQWHEQHVPRGPLVHGDCHGKRDNAIRLDGSKDLMWTYTEMNGFGHKTISVKVNTTSMNDASLVAASDRRYRADRRWNHTPVVRVTSDNPRKDGQPMLANVFIGDGLTVMDVADYDVALIVTEADCDRAIAHLEQRYTDDFVGFDTENVAYFGKHAGEGTTSDKSALAQVAGFDVVFLFVLHKWRDLYASFARFMANPRILKYGNAVSTDVRKLTARFPTIQLVGIMELSTLVKASFPNLSDGSLKTMTREVLKVAIDKRIDHRFWEAERYTRRQTSYAACDAIAARRLVAAAIIARQSAAAATAAPPPSTEPVDGAAEEDARAFEAADQGERVACTRTRARDDTFDAGDNDDDDDDDDDVDVPGLETIGIGPATTAAAVLTDNAGAHATTSPVSIVARCKQLITDYHNSQRTDDLTLPASLTDRDRKTLHNWADQYALYHRSQGPSNARVMVLSRWRPFQTQSASVADSALGALVAFDTDTDVARGILPQTHRGYVSGFDRETMRWELKYPTLADSAHATEIADIDMLNRRMQRRFDYDHGSSGLGEPGTRPARGAVSNRNDAETLQKFIDGIAPDWQTGKWSRLSYDPAHFMRNFASMLAVDKHSDVEKVFNGWQSESMFKIMAGEYTRGKLHAKRLGLTDDQIARLRRKYWRRHLKYLQPDPETIIRGLFDIYVFFRDLEDPLRPGAWCLKTDALDILMNEMWYVQMGLLSDIPGIDTYLAISRCPTTQFMRYRCLKTASPLEGMHFHYRQGAWHVAWGFHYRQAHPVVNLVVWF